MSDISKIKIKGTSYDIKDETARADIEELKLTSVKSGEKDLIPIYDMGASLRYAKCAYQLIGDFVIMTVDIVLNSSTNIHEDGLLFGGLPYPFSPLTSTGSLRGICVSTNNSLVRWRLNNASVNYQGQNLNATCLNITNDSGTWKSGEGIGFTIVYKADPNYGVK